LSVTTMVRRQPPTSRWDQEASGDAERLHDTLTDLIRLYQFRDRNAICWQGISVTQCYALEAIVRGGPPSLKYVAEWLYLDKSTTSRVISSLVQKRYVERAPHPDDPRSVLLRPTPAGRRLHHRIRRTLVRQAQQILRDFSPAARRGAIELLSRLTRATATRMDRGPSCARRAK
jgi:MarR family 2-MHQ and catechol resistance regulon transcriptional repressor